jgi:DnaJ-class molecular chaperone
MREPFEILGVGRNASQRGIKKRYRLLSKQFHPDLNGRDPEAEERFKEVQWAYETLSGKQSWKEGIESTAERGSNQRSDPADWSEKPFVGFFQAMKAYAERRRSRSDETRPRDLGDFPSE